MMMMARRLGGGLVLLMMMLKLTCRSVWCGWFQRCARAARVDELYSSYTPTSQCHYYSEDF
jgi:hypothetical protein